MEKQQKIIIRKATYDDIPEINNIIKEAFSEYKSLSEAKRIDALYETLDDIKKDIDTKIVLVAVCRDEVIASARIKADKEKNEAYLSRFAVKGNSRKKGVGKLMMNEVDGIVKREKIARVSLHTDSKISNLVKFYQDRGFCIESINTDRGYKRAKMVKEYN